MIGDARTEQGQTARGSSGAWSRKAHAPPRGTERGRRGPCCRVAPQSQIHIGTDQKNTIFALFWPENASN